MVTCVGFGSAHLMVRGSWFGSTRLNRVDWVKSGQHSELTRQLSRSTQLTRSTQSNVSNAKELEYCRIHASKPRLGNDITKS
ncbi:hypothetical protein HanPI659440_Chr07g0255281 [Helianthus annuus]|nr:hypothetical protein HanPI659440_Chr07g0255281 [Helianthus annuus]